MKDTDAPVEGWSVVEAHSKQNLQYARKWPLTVQTTLFKSVKVDRSAHQSGQDSHFHADCGASCQRTTEACGCKAAGCDVVRPAGCMDGRVPIWTATMQNDD